MKKRLSKPNSESATPVVSNVDASRVETIQKVYIVPEHGVSVSATSASEAIKKAKKKAKETK